MDFNYKETDLMNRMVIFYWQENNMHHTDNSEDWEISKIIVKKLTIPAVSGSASDFEKDLGKLINNYIKKGLKKPDLVKKMEWMTDNCKFS